MHIARYALALIVCLAAATASAGADPLPEAPALQRTAEPPQGPPVETLAAEEQLGEHAVVWDARAPIGLTGAHRAVHPRLGLEAFFDGRVVHVRPEPSPGESPAWQLELELVSVGRADAMHAPATGALRVAGTRVTIDRGSVLEWYDNGERGLQQGFVVVQSPDGSGALRLDLATRGGLTPSVEAERRSARFFDADEHVRARYEGLLAWDATGRPLEAWLEAHDTTLSILVDDAGATWPIVIDPYIMPEKIVASDGTDDDHFGTAVALSGTTFAVGAPGKDDSRGALYIFEHDGTRWSQTHKLLASDAASGDGFGSAVALSETTLLVAAPGDDGGRSLDSGAVYIFEHDGTAWIETQKLLASDAASGDGFGSAVALSDSTLLVAAPGDDEGRSVDSGAVYVFGHDGTRWTQTHKLRASDAASGDGFGSAVALFDSTLLVGAPGDDDGTFDSGAGYVFASAGTGWVQTQKLSASVPQDGARLGTAVSLAGPILAISALEPDDRGAVHIFEFDHTSWRETRKILASDAASGDAFGSALVLSGTTLLAGAPGDDDGDHFDSGAVYVLVNDGTGWSEFAQVFASDAASDDRFGFSVALDEKTFISGAPNQPGGGTHSGAVYANLELLVAVTDYEVCWDSKDNDYDGANNCLDVDCCNYLFCVQYPGYSQVCSGELCFDGIDNDDNGAADCLDPACCTYAACASFAFEVCADGAGASGNAEQLTAELPGLETEEERAESGVEVAEEDTPDHGSTAGLSATPTSATTDGGCCTTVRTGREHRLPWQLALALGAVLLLLGLCRVAGRRESCVVSRES